MKKINNLLPLALAMLFVFSGCSSSGSSGSSDSVSITDIDGLPNATAPVVSEDGSASINALHALVRSLATTGLNLESTTESDFTDGSSYAACQMYNQTKEAIQAAAEGDNILCYVKQADMGAVDIYDGEYHAFDLNLTVGEGEEGGDGGPDHIKVKVVKSGDVVTGFELFACRDGVQFYHVNQAIDGTDFTMSAKSNDRGGFEADVTGTLNASGQFTGNKTISLRNVYRDEDNSSQTNYSEMTFIQSADSIETTGYQAGEYESEECSGTYSDVISASAQLLDENSGDDYDIGLLALGDGAVKGIRSGTFECNGFSGEYEDSFTEAWNGDTVVAVDSNDFLTDISSDTLVSVGSEPEIEFEGTEVYDCGDTAEGTLDMDQDVLSASCAQFEFSGNWINCYDATGQNN